MDDARSLDCPDCGGALQRQEQRGRLLHECRRCGGQFVEYGVLAEILEPRTPSYDISRKPRPSSNPLEHSVRYRPCPACRQMMNRKNFGGRSGVIVDACGRHGLWFDRGELEAVLRFVEHGGLVQARRDREHRERHDARLRALSAPGPVSVRRVTPLPDDPTSLSDLGQGVIELIEFLHDVLRPDHPHGLR